MTRPVGGRFPSLQEQFNNLVAEWNKKASESFSNEDEKSQQAEELKILSHDIEKLGKTLNLTTEQKEQFNKIKFWQSPHSLDEKDESKIAEDEDPELQAMISASINLSRIDILKELLELRNRINGLGGFKKSSSELGGPTQNLLVKSLKDQIEALKKQLEEERKKTTPPHPIKIPRFVPPDSSKESDLSKKLNQINQNTKEGAEYIKTSDDENKTPNEGIMEILRRFKIGDTASKLEQNYADLKRADDEKKLNLDDKGWFNSNKLLRALYKIKDFDEAKIEELVNSLNGDLKNTSKAKIKERKALGEITIGDISVFDELDDVKRYDDGNAIYAYDRKILKELLQIIPKNPEEQKKFFDGFGYARDEKGYRPERSDDKGNFSITIKSENIPGKSPSDVTAETLLTLGKQKIPRGI